MALAGARTERSLERTARLGDRPGVSQSLPLAGRRALVTGAAAGIGAATARRLADDGATVLLSDAVAPAAGAPSHNVVADVTDPLQVAEAVSLAAGDDGLDICVANAGVSLMEDFLDGTPASWERVLRVNLLGVMLTLQAAARSMVERGGEGRLLATASIAALHGEPGSSAYCASKAGVIALIKTLAIELAPWRITANAVAPGQVDTAMNARDLETVASAAGRPGSDLLGEHLERRVPVGRLGTPEEIAAAFAFLASDDAAFVNGAVLRVDGGELAS
jgi:NAD(P)-dependent dehydrogenase (short-subunit alcohol dehydrogenase family)